MLGAAGAVAPLMGLPSAGPGSGIAQSHSWDFRAASSFATPEILRNPYEVTVAWFMLMLCQPGRLENCRTLPLLPGLDSSKGAPACRFEALCRQTIYGVRRTFVGPLSWRLR
jgi:hypothetical protein